MASQMSALGNRGDINIVPKGLALRLLRCVGMSDDIRALIAANEAQLKTKD